MMEKWILEICRLLRTDMETAQVLLIVAGVVLMMLVLTWLFGAFALSTMAKYRWISGRWMAWVPVCNVVLLGLIHDRYMDEVKNISTDRRLSLPILLGAVLTAGAATGYLWILWRQGMEIAPAMSIIVIAVGVCALVVLVAFLALLYITCYNVCYSCVPDDAVLYTIIVVLFPVAIPFVLFGLRRKLNGMPPSRFHISG